MAERFQLQDEVVPTFQQEKNFPILFHRINPACHFTTCKPAAAGIDVERRLNMQVTSGRLRAKVFQLVCALSLTKRRKVSPVIADITDVPFAGRVRAKRATLVMSNSHSKHAPNEIDWAAPMAKDVMDKLEASLSDFCRVDERAVPVLLAVLPNEQRVRVEPLLRAERDVHEPMAVPIERPRLALDVPRPQLV